MGSQILTSCIAIQNKLTTPTKQVQGKVLYKSRDIFQIHRLIFQHQCSVAVKTYSKTILLNLANAGSTALPMADPVPCQIQLDYACCKCKRVIRRDFCPVDSKESLATMVCTPEASEDSDGNKIHKCNHIPYGCPTCKPLLLYCPCHSPGNKDRLAYPCPVCHSESGQPGDSQGPSLSST
jgi:hypothetical protein